MEECERESLYIAGQLQGISPAEQFSRLGHLEDCGGDQKGQGSFYQLTAGRRTSNKV